MYDMPRTLDRVDSGVVTARTPTATLVRAAADANVFVVIADIAVQPSRAAATAPWLQAIGALGLAVEADARQAQVPGDDLVDFWVDAAGVRIAVPAIALQSAALTRDAAPQEGDLDAGYLSDRAALRPLVASWHGSHVVFLGAVHVAGEARAAAPRTAIQARVEATAQEIVDACDTSGVRCTVLRPAENATLPPAPRPSQAVGGRVLMLTPALHTRSVAAAA